MYIPLTYLDTDKNLCISASGGDEIGYFTSGSDIWKYHRFNSVGSGSYIIHSGSALHRVLIVGGGGCGGIQSATSVTSPGGGGGGGIVYLDNIIFTPNTYNLYVGNGGDIQAGTITPLKGEDSYLDYLYQISNNNQVINSNRLIARGGGRGAQAFLNAGSGGCGGGSSTYISGNNRVTGSLGTALYNPNDVIPFGFDGGRAQFVADTYGGGGGGAAGAGKDTLANNGGNSWNAVDIFGGINMNFSRGGHGKSWDESPFPPASFKGSGGSGARQNQSGWENIRKGKSGEIFVMYRVCQDDREKCNQYLINGGANGGTFYYLPCGGTELTSWSLDPLDELTICSFPIDSSPNGFTYPYTDGTATFSLITSCSNYIPPVNPPSCGTGSELTQMNLTEISVNAPAVGPYPGYINFEGLDWRNQRVSFGFGSGTYNKCIISGSLRRTTSTIGSSYSSFYTSEPCAFYCETTASQDVVSGSVVNVNLPLTQAANYTTSSQIQLDWVNDSVTMEIWFGSSTEYSCQYRSIMNLNDNSAGGDRDFMEIRYLDTNCTSGIRNVKVYGLYFDGTTDINTPQGTNVNAEWNHHILTWTKSTGEMRYYRNGQYIGSAIVSNISTELNNPYLNVGIKDTGTDSLNGYYGEYRVYPFNLDDSQVLYNYEQTKGRYGY